MGIEVDSFPHPGQLPFVSLNSLSLGFMPLGRQTSRILERFNMLKSLNPCTSALKTS